MESMTRRGFVELIGAATVGSAIVAGSAQAEETNAFGGSSPEVIAVGGSDMSVKELNRRRRELVESKGEYVCEDGTVIPAVWAKLRALVNTYGYGVGSETLDQNFEFFQMVFETEENAQAYLDMPYGVMFTPVEYSEVSGRTEEECASICEDLANRGLLWRTRRAGVAHYHQVPFAHGMYEYNLNNFYEDGWIAASRTVMAPDVMKGMIDAGTSFYYPIPVNKEIVADEQVLLHDDWEKIIRRNEVIAVSPCQCRLARMVQSGEPRPPAIGSFELSEFRTPVCGHRLETCISTGEEAEYYIERGIGRQITQEEALKILQEVVDEGMVVQSAFTQHSEILCCCHGDCCGILGAYIAAGPDAFGASSAHPNISHYILTYDEQPCIQCGACVGRCPMTAISMGSDGKPMVNDLCVRCGQCGLVCPVGARKLTAKPKEEMLELPEEFLDDYNLQAAFRFESGTIF